jgi:dienelactone hydrolase
MQLNTEFIDYQERDLTFEAYAAYPSNLASPAPCALVMHDWSGQNQYTRATAEKLARLGYFALALDVYGKGVRGSLTGDNSALMDPMIADRDLLRRRLLAGLHAAQNRPEVDSRRVAVLGYCFGGLCALDLARAAPEGLKAAVSFHAPLKPPNIGEQLPVKASILMLHGWDDPVAPPPDVLAVAAEFTAAGADWQLHSYGHAQHAFTFPGANMPERGIVYNAAADRRSWASMEAFVRETLA